MPVGFSDYQLGLIRNAARHVSVEWRSRFLEAVIAHVLPHPVLTDEMVHAAVTAVLGRLVP